MNNPVLVQPTLENVDDLIVALKDEGLDARRAQRKPFLTLIPGAMIAPPWEAVVIWLAAQTTGAVINLVVSDVVDWMRDRFRQNPERKRPKTALLVFYEGDEARAVEVVELKSPDAEPVRRPATEFEKYTRTKPSEE